MARRRTADAHRAASRSVSKWARNARSPRGVKATWFLPRTDARAMGYSPARLGIEWRVTSPVYLRAEAVVSMICAVLLATGILTAPQPPGRGAEATPGSPHAEGTAAERITLHDGSIVLGLVTSVS